MSKIHIGLLKDIVMYEPILIDDKFGILITDRFGFKWLDKVEYKDTIYLLDNEKLAKDYCKSMMEMVREKEKIKDLSVNGINIWE